MPPKSETPPRPIIDQEGVLDTPPIVPKDGLENTIPTPLPSLSLLQEACIIFHLAGGVKRLAVGGIGWPPVQDLRILA